MATAAQLRGELLRQKEAFDRAVFDTGLTRAERLARWQAFLTEVKPLSERITRAERFEDRERRRITHWQPTGTAAMI